MNLINEVGKALREVISCTGITFKAFPEWFGIGGTTE